MITCFWPTESKGNKALQFPNTFLTMPSGWQHADQDAPLVCTSSIWNNNWNSVNGFAQFMFELESSCWIRLFDCLFGGSTVLLFNCSPAFER